MKRQSGPKPRTQQTIHRPRKAVCFSGAILGLLVETGRYNGKVGPGDKMCCTKSYGLSAKESPTICGDRRQPDHTMFTWQRPLPTQVNRSPNSMEGQLRVSSRPLLELQVGSSRVNLHRRMLGTPPRADSGTGVSAPISNVKFSPVPPALSPHDNLGRESTPPTPTTRPRFA